MANRCAGNRCATLWGAAARLGTQAVRPPNRGDTALRTASGLGRNLGRRQAVTVEEVGAGACSASVLSEG